MGLFDFMGEHEMTTFDELLNEAVEQREAAPNTETVEVLVGKNLVTLKLTEMDPVEWVGVMSVHPPRKGAEVDGYVAYDYHAVVKDVAPLSCVRLDGDAAVLVSAEQWEKIFKVLAPQSFVLMADAVWKLNVLDPAERTAAAKKALLALTDSTEK